MSLAERRIVIASPTSLPHGTMLRLGVRDRPPWSTWFSASSAALRQRIRHVPDAVRGERVLETLLWRRASFSPAAPGSDCLRPLALTGLRVSSLWLFGYAASDSGGGLAVLASVTVVPAPCWACWIRGKSPFAAVGSRASTDSTDSGDDTHLDHLNAVTPELATAVAQQSWPDRHWVHPAAGSHLLAVAPALSLIRLGHADAEDSARRRPLPVGPCRPHHARHFGPVAACPASAIVATLYCTRSSPCGCRARSPAATSTGGGGGGDRGRQTAIGPVTATALGGDPGARNGAGLPMVSTDGGVAIIR